MTRGKSESQNSEFKKGDKFILELGEERRMFDEFEIAGTDLCVRKDLLEKLTPYTPFAQQTLFGYKIEHLAYIARVMEKEGITAEYAVRTFDDMSRAIRMIHDETQQKVEEMLNEQFNQQTGVV